MPAPREKKRRLDQELVSRGLFDSREQAQAAIMAGLVRVGDAPATKAGLAVAADAAIAVTGQLHPYVSRGGLKLAEAIAAFGLAPVGKVALDAGASTGGFTDVLLMHGARRVYAVDVGYGQLAWKLRRDPRVVVMERTNVRHLAPEALPELPELLVADLSFISLALVLPAFAALLAPGGEAALLIKPQFEAGRELVKKGVVKDPAVHAAVIATVAEAAARHGLVLVGLAHSPIKGPEGNREFLGHFRPSGDPVTPEAIAAVVAAAHAAL